MSKTRTKKLVLKLLLAPFALILLLVTGLLLWNIAGDAKRAWSCEFFDATSFQDHASLIPLARRRVFEATHYVSRGEQPTHSPATEEEAARWRPEDFIFDHFDNDLENKDVVSMYFRRNDRPTLWYNAVVSEGCYVEVYYSRSSY